MNAADKKYVDDAITSKLSRIMAILETAFPEVVEAPEELPPSVFDNASNKLDIVEQRMEESAEDEWYGSYSKLPSYTSPFTDACFVQPEPSKLAVAPEVIKDLKNKAGIDYSGFDSVATVKPEHATLLGLDNDFSVPHDEHVSTEASMKKLGIKIEDIGPSDKNKTHSHFFSPPLKIKKEKVEKKSKDVPVTVYESNPVDKNTFVVQTHLTIEQVKEALAAAYSTLKVKQDDLNYIRKLAGVDLVSKLTN